MTYYTKYARYELPAGWEKEEDGEHLTIYDPEGEGAITISFLNILQNDYSFDEQLSILAKRFIDQNHIKTHSPLILSEKKHNKKQLTGTGSAIDGWFVKFWLVAKKSRILFITYLSEKKTEEVLICDSIIESIEFTI